VTSALTPKGAPRAILGPAIDLVRASSLVARHLGAPSAGFIALWLLSALMGLSHARTPDDSAGIMRALWVSMFCTGISLGTGMTNARAGTLIFLETRPLRVSANMIVALPFFVIAAIFVAFVSAMGHWGLAKASAVFGCAWWAIDLAILIPNPRSSALAFFALGAVGILTALFSYAGGGWNATVIAIVPLAAIGWFAAPSRNAWRIERESPKASSQGKGRPASPPTVATTYRTQKKTTTAFDLLTLIVWGRYKMAGTNTVVQPLLAGLAIALALVDHSHTWNACAFWLLVVMSQSGLFVAAFSRPSLEFLATRPLGARRLILGIAAPWLVALGSLPPLLLACSERGVVRFGDYRVTTVSLLARLVLVAIAHLFCLSLDALRPPRTRIPLVTMGLYLLLAPLLLPWFLPIKIRGLPWWLPPTWLVGGYAVVVVTLWVRRMPWHLLSPAR
jgi:hypothetical protein